MFLSFGILWSDHSLRMVEFCFAGKFFELALSIFKWYCLVRVLCMSYTFFFLCKTSVEIFVVLFGFSVTVFCKVNIHKTRSSVTFCGCVAEWNVGM